MRPCDLWSGADLPQVCARLSHLAWTDMPGSSLCSHSTYLVQGSAVQSITQLATSPASYLQEGAVCCRVALRTTLHHPGLQHSM